MRAPPALPWVLLGCAVLAAAGTSLANGFAYDDTAAIVANARVHALRPPWAFLGESYWPPESSGSLYRPVTILGFSLQWALGDGAPVVFHVVNVALKLATTLALFALLRRVAPPGAALAGALYFAVHPVHTEAVGNVVGQAELHAALAACLAGLWWVRGRAAGPPTPGLALGVAMLTVYGALGKEQGLLIPVLVGVLEGTVARDDRPWSLRRRSLLLPALLGVMTMAGLWALRSAVLGDDLAGPIAWQIRGLGPAERGVAMLGIVPTWLRLLAWPWHLRAEYNPPAFPVLTAMTPIAWAGAALVLAWLAATLHTWRREPLAAAGLLWVGVALSPVANVLIPTGIFAAERTLLLPSAGAALVVAAAWRALDLRLSPAARRVAVLAGTAAIAAWTLRSADRMRVWKDTDVLFRQMVVDEPNSYKSHFHLGELLNALGKPDSAEVHMRAAYDLWRGDGRFLEDYGQLLRALGRCDEAVPVLRASLALEDDRVKARSRLFFCLLRLERFAEARDVGRRGLELGDTIFELHLARLDSLAAARR